MTTQIPLPMPCASRFRACASGWGNPGLSPPWLASAIASTRCPSLGTARIIMNRPQGLSVRLKLTLSYAGFLVLTGFLMLAAVWLAGRPGQSFDLLLRYVPNDVI